MKKFNTDNWELGLLAVCRNDMYGDESHKYALAIQFGLGSWSNHNSMTATHNGMCGFCEAVEPVSRFTTVHEYEALMKKGYQVRLYRIKTLTVEQRENAAKYFLNNLLGKPYPPKFRMILLTSRIINSLNIKLRIKNWCSQLCKIAFLFQNQNCLNGPIQRDGKPKVKNDFTPKTFENRIIQGLFEDVTDDIIVEV